MHELSILGNTREWWHNMSVYSRDCLCPVLNALSAGKTVINCSKSSRGGLGLEHLLCKGRLTELDLCSLEKRRLNSDLTIPTQRLRRSWRQACHSSTLQEDKKAMDISLDERGWISGETCSPWDQSGIRADCPERLYSLLPWTFSRPSGWSPGKPGLIW